MWLLLFTDINPVVMISRRAGSLIEEVFSISCVKNGPKTENFLKNEADTFLNTNQQIVKHFPINRRHLNFASAATCKTLKLDIISFISRLTNEVIHDRICSY